jgi:hypothetical protein
VHDLPPPPSSPVRRGCCRPSRGRQGVAGCPLRPHCRPRVDWSFPGRHPSLRRSPIHRSTPAAQCGVGRLLGGLVQWGPREVTLVASRQVLRQTRAQGASRRSPPPVRRDTPPPPPPPHEGFMVDARRSGPSVEVEDGWEVKRKHRPSRSPRSPPPARSPPTARQVPTDLVGYYFNCFATDHVNAHCPLPARCFHYDRLAGPPLRGLRPSLGPVGGSSRTRCA